MKILIKQFFRTFKKNIFLVLGLASLISVLSFLVSASINISQSFNNSYSKLRNDGNAADVVASKPDEYGYLDFSFSTNNSDITPVEVWTPTIEPQIETSKLKPGYATFSRNKNTFLPYSWDWMQSRKAIKGQQTKASLADSIKVNPDATNLNETFIFNLDKKNAIWNYPYVLSVHGPLNLDDAPNPSQGIGFSFSDDNGKIYLNPNQFIFNEQGIPMYLFGNGNLDNNATLAMTFKSGVKSIENELNQIYDDNGFGIVNYPNSKLTMFDRAKAANDALHNTKIDFSIDSKLFNTSETNLDYPNYFFSHFITKQKVTPFKFEINLNNSNGVLKEVVSKNSDILEKAFNNVFYGNHIKRQNENDPLKKYLDNNKEEVKNIKSNIYFENNAIYLAVSDQMFIDYSSIILDAKTPPASIAQELEKEKNKQITENKSLFLNNFKGYLSSKISNELIKIINDEIDSFLDENKIDKEIHSEYFYSDVKDKIDYLFVGKPNKGIDDVVVYEGKGLVENNDNILDVKENLNYWHNGEISTNMIFAFNELINRIPDDKYIKSYGDIGPINSSNQNFLFLLNKYSSNKLVELMEQNNLELYQALPYEITKTPYFKMFAKLNSLTEVEYAGSVVNLKLENQYEFTTLHFLKDFSLRIIDNLFCVINPAFADVNKKKIIPSENDDIVINHWTEEINKINAIKNEAKQKDEFNNWMETRVNKDEKYVLSNESMNTVFDDNDYLLDLYLEKLSPEYKIKYKKTFYLINGFGLSPEFAYPVISQLNPVPSPENQVIVYLSKQTYDLLGISDVNKYEYLTFASDGNLSNGNVIEKVNEFIHDKYNSDFLKLENINDSKNLPLPWIRMHFPDEINSLIILFSVIGSIVLSLLTILVVYFLLKSFIKNLLEPIALCIGNGIPMSKIILACLANLGVMTTITSIGSYVISYFVQKPLIGLFSNIWFVPATLPISFSPAIFIPLAAIIFLIFGGILSWILYLKFKKPIPQIIANKEDIKANKLTNILKNNKLRIPSISKFALGFSTVNIGKLSLLSIIGSIALGGVVSSVMVNDKFNEAKNLTSTSQKLNFQYNFVDVNESTGLYKAQPLEYIGTEDKSIGIESIYLPKAQWDAEKVSSNKYPYYKEQFVLSKIADDGKTVVPIGNNESEYKYLSNMVYPSYSVYEKINDNNSDVFFNAASSIFLLDVPVTFLSVTINIWEFIKPNFPNWLVNQLESQAQEFQNAIMKYFGEWYYQLINIPNDIKLPTNITPINDNGTNYYLKVKNFNEENQGMYFLKAKNKNKKDVYSKPYFLWKEDAQKYRDDNKVTERIVKPLGSDFSFKELTADTPLYTKISGSYVKSATINQVTDAEWVFVPAYDYYHNLDKSKVTKSDSDLHKIRYSDEFIDFIKVIYGDKYVSSQDSKVSFGIVPYDKESDELATSIKAINDIDNLPINILGIEPNSKCVKLFNEKNKDISNLIANPSNSNQINVIINNGASYKYKLKVGDTFDIIVKNNSLHQSYEIMKDLIGTNNDPIKTRYTLKVVGVNTDSFDEKFYVNIDDANYITGLTEMPVYTSLTPEVKYLDKQANNFKPFNTILSNYDEMIISYKSLPFYTFASIWNLWTNSSQIINYRGVKKTLALLVSQNQSIVEQTVKFIEDNKLSNIKFDHQNPEVMRNQLVRYVQDNYSISAFLKLLSDLKQKDILQPSIAGAIPTKTISTIFDSISSLAGSLIAIVSSISIPLLLIVTLIISLSFINDLFRNIGLMKVVGYSNRNIMLMFAMIYSPAFLITALLGLGISFAATYGVQFMIYNLLSIFLYPSISASTYFIGLSITLLIFILSILFISFTVRRKGLENTFKF